MTDDLRAMIQRVSGQPDASCGVSVEEATRNLRAACAALPTVQDIADSLAAIPPEVWREMDRAFGIAMVLHGDSRLIRELADQRRAQ